MVLAVWVFLLSVALIPVDALKIMVVSPTFGRSHMQFMGNLADLYVRNGHEVVYFEPELVDHPVLHFQSSKLARSIKKKKSWGGEEKTFAAFVTQSWTQDHESLLQGLSGFSEFSKVIRQSCHDILNDEALLTQLRNEKFDIGVAEVLTICPYALYRKIGITKYISASATPIGAGLGALFGVASIPPVTYVPEFFTVPFEQGTFMFRVSNMLNFVFGGIFFKSVFMDSVKVAIDQHYPNMNLEEAIANSSYVFINANEHIEFVRPMPLKFVNVAGIGVPENKPLPEDYRKFMDSATNGAVLVSFGTSPLGFSMPTHIKKTFLDAFDHFPTIKFLWKYENFTENIAKNHPNVFVQDWIPQVDILNHKNTIGFISHGGMNSLIESSVFGVPTICIALFGDQPRNCKMSEQRGISIRLPKLDLNAETLKKALQELIYNKKYLNQARNIQSMISGAPMSANQRALRYTEFAAKFDVATNLDDQGRYLSCVAFYNLDIFALLILLFVLLLFIVYYIFRWFLGTILRCFSYITGASKQKSE